MFTKCHYRPAEQIVAFLAEYTYSASDILLSSPISVYSVALYASITVADMTEH